MPSPSVPRETRMSPLSDASTPCAPVSHSAEVLVLRTAVRVAEELSHRPKATPQCPRHHEKTGKYGIAGYSERDRQRPRSNCRNFHYGVLLY